MKLKVCLQDKEPVEKHYPDGTLIREIADEILKL